MKTAALRGQGKEGQKNTKAVFKFNIFSRVGSALTVTLSGMTVVKIMYGPYEAYGVIKHRFQKIRGLYGCVNVQKKKSQFIRTRNFFRWPV